MVAMGLARIKESLTDSDDLFTKLLDKGRKGAAGSRCLNDHQRMPRHKTGKLRNRSSL